jgi:two-component system sensor histidine kinase BaeS
VVTTDDLVTEDVAVALSDPEFLETLANRVGLADVRIVVGAIVPAPPDSFTIDPASNGTYFGALTAPPEAGQSREDREFGQLFRSQNRAGFPYALEVTLVDPYTFRAQTLANVTGLILVIGIIGLALAILVAAFLAARFAAPVRRLSEAARSIGEGDLASRVPLAEARAGSAELVEVSRQFNAMAGRLEESIEIVRRDRDRSREFLADVSHELRTPITSLRMFVELLQGPAGDDPATRSEFLESSAGQLGRLDWLAQNLLELSKLDSGLVLLDLRPDDLRASVESATEQVLPAAERRGVSLVCRLPESPVRTLHDPQRIGQVVTNLVGNAVKFTPRGGAVTVELESRRDGAAIVVRDTGEGIPADELPHIFERFYRGARATEARSAGSGLGLAIVKSIVDMHGGRIGVESRLGTGSTFTVVLPREARVVRPVPPPAARADGETFTEPREPAES